MNKKFIEIGIYVAVVVAGGWLLYSLIAWQDMRINQDLYAMVLKSDPSFILGAPEATFVDFDKEELEHLFKLWGDIIELERDEVEIIPIIIRELK